VVNGEFAGDYIAKIKVAANFSISFVYLSLLRGKIDVTIVYYDG
jgi:hypothetical protein